MSGGTWSRPEGVGGRSGIRCRGRRGRQGWRTVGPVDTESKVNQVINRGVTRTDGRLSRGPLPKSSRGTGVPGLESVQVRPFRGPPEGRGVVSRPLVFLGGPLTHSPSLFSQVWVLLGRGREGPGHTVEVCVEGVGRDRSVTRDRPTPSVLLRFRSTPVQSFPFRGTHRNRVGP